MKIKLLKKQQEGDAFVPYLYTIQLGKKKVEVHDFQDDNNQWDWYVGKVYLANGKLGYGNHDLTEKEYDNLIEFMQQYQQ